MKLTKKLNNVSYLDLFIFSLKIGVNALLKGNVTKESIKRILCPLDVSRYYEIPKVINSLIIKKGMKVLDISSPKLITYYLATKFPGVTFYATDKFKSELASWEKLMPNIKNVIVKLEDATKLTFKNNLFDIVYSVSVIEHLGNEKNFEDTKMIVEVERVLKSRGTFALTTIISNKSKIVFKNKNLYSTDNNKINKTFFCRIYSYPQLKDRLLNKTNLKVTQEEVCNYKYTFYEYIFNTLMPLSILLGWVNLLFVPFMLNTTNKTDNINSRSEYFASFLK